MSRKMLLGVSFAAACLMAVPVAFAQPADQLITNGPQSDGVGNSSHWSPSQNVRESEHYEHMLQSSRAFRMARMKKECGPINDPQLHASCVSSFNQDESQYGSSTPPQPIYHNLGSGNSAA